MKRLAELLFAAAAVLPAAAHEPPAPLGFTPPPAGSYALPPIQAVPDGEVLDLAGRTRPLREFTRGRITLLGLVYTRCADPDACPRATWAFSSVRSMLRSEPALAARVRLVTLSFDPDHDTPPVLARYASKVRGARGAEWRFLTTRSRRELAPILDGLGQDLSVAADSSAVPGTEEFSHALKVFLVDPRGRVREIYTSAYLMPAMVVTDIRTLALESRPHSTGAQVQNRFRSP